MSHKDEDRYLGDDEDMQAIEESQDLRARLAVHSVTPTTKQLIDILETTFPASTELAVMYCTGKVTLQQLDQGAQDEYYSYMERISHLSPDEYMKEVYSA